MAATVMPDDLHDLHAHRIGLRAERTAVETAGVSRRAYQGFMKKHEKPLGEAKLRRGARDLGDLDPTRYREFAGFSPAPPARDQRAPAGSEAGARQRFSTDDLALRRRPAFATGCHAAHKRRATCPPAQPIASTFEHSGEARLASRGRSCILPMTGTRAPWRGIRRLQLSFPASV